MIHTSPLASVASTASRGQGAQYGPALSEHSTTFDLTWRTTLETIDRDLPSIVDSIMLLIRSGKIKGQLARDLEKLCAEARRSPGYPFSTYNT